MLGGALAVQTIDRSENARIDRHGLNQNAVRWFGLRRRSGRATVTGHERATGWTGTGPPHGSPAQLGGETLNEGAGS